MKKSELVGARDIAKRLGLSTQAVTRWRERHADFPEPIALINEKDFVWRWAPVRAWSEKTGRMKAGKSQRLPGGRPAFTKKKKTGK